MKKKSFDTLVEKFLKKGLPGHLSGTVSLSKLPPGSQAFILRVLWLMKRSGYSAVNFNPALIRWLFVTIPNISPTAWGGRIPPITLPNRHGKFDEYVARQIPAPGNKPHIFVDAGCGFPPVTTADTARRLPDWEIYGIDRFFADYILYTIDGHYACFDQDGVFQYFQAFMSVTGRALYQDPKGTRNRFDELFAELFPLLTHLDGTASETVEKDGNRLVHNHILDFKTDNLTFIQSDIMEIKLPLAKVFRCMNILLYFKPDIRKKMLVQAGRHLDDDGILIAGTNGIGIQSRYAVYQKSQAGLFPREFAFSLDNLGHIVFMPWLTIHEHDPEAMLLAELAGTIRSDPSFWPEFSSRMDELLQHQDICLRGVDGFLHFPKEELSPGKFLERNVMLWEQMQEEGYADRAVATLERAGYDAWKNPVGDIAVRPPANALL